MWAEALSLYEKSLGGESKGGNGGEEKSGKLGAYEQEGLEIFG